VWWKEDNEKRGHNEPMCSKECCESYINEIPVGKTCDITDKNSIYYGAWGIIVMVDTDGYYVAIYGGTDSVPCFDRDQIKIRK
jgi:hypothetical protein